MNSLDRYTSNRNKDTKLSVFEKFSSTANQNLKIYFKILSNSQITSL